jgi:hypothetical protein
MPRSAWIARERLLHMDVRMPRSAWIAGERPSAIAFFNIQMRRFSAACKDFPGPLTSCQFIELSTGVTMM